MRCHRHRSTHLPVEKLAGKALLGPSAERRGFLRVLRPPLMGIRARRSFGEKSPLHSLTSPRGEQTTQACANAC